MRSRALPVRTRSHSRLAERALSSERSHSERQHYPSGRGTYPPWLPAFPLLPRHFHLAVPARETLAPRCTLPFSLPSLQFREPEGETPLRSEPRALPIPTNAVAFREPGGENGRHHVQAGRWRSAPPSARPAEPARAACAGVRASPRASFP
jgi:hypothetical protein